MSRLETAVVSHYDIDGLLDTILGAVGAPEPVGCIEPERLSPVDEFHLGSAAATARLIPHLRLSQGDRLIDIGSGVGGPARHVARETGAEVTGIDLTPGYRHVAERLSELSRLAQLTRFVTGSALELPFEDGSFDAAMMLHVGMNIEDKNRLMAEAARVLRPGGVFVVYDIMRVAEGEPQFPLPWAGTPDCSFLRRAPDYRAAAEAAGLSVTAEVSRAPEAKAFLQETLARMESFKAQGLPPPPGVNLMMGEGAPVKLANLGAAVMQDLLAPIEIVLKRPN